MFYLPVLKFLPSQPVLLQLILHRMSEPIHLMLVTFASHGKLHLKALGDVIKFKLNFKLMNPAVLPPLKLMVAKQVTSLIQPLIKPFRFALVLLTLRAKVLGLQPQQPEQLEPRLLTPSKVPLLPTFKDHLESLGVVAKELIGI